MSLFDFIFGKNKKKDKKIVEQKIVNNHINYLNSTSDFYKYLDTEILLINWKKQTTSDEFLSFLNNKRIKYRETLVKGAGVVYNYHILLPIISGGFEKFTVQFINSFRKKEGTLFSQTLIFEPFQNSEMRSLFSFFKTYGFWTETNQVPKSINNYTAALMSPDKKYIMVIIEKDFPETKNILIRYQED
jgi:hypothetical protein